LFVFILGIVYLVREQYAIRRGSEGTSFRKILQEWKGYQICFRGFSHQYASTRYFYLIYITRIILPGLIAAWLYIVPLLQTLLYVLITFMMLTYILLRRPVVNLLNYVQLILTETAILVIDICLFGLAVSNQTKISVSSESSEILGDLIVGMNSMINILFIIVLIIKLLDGIVTIYKEHNANKVVNFSGYIQLFVYVFQQTGFGFEQISVNTQKEIEKEEGLMADEREREQLLQTRRGYMMKNKAGRIFPEARREHKSASQIERIGRTLTTLKGASPEMTIMAPGTSLVMQDVSFFGRDEGSPNLSIEKIPGEQEGNKPLVIGSRSQKNI